MAKRIWVRVAPFDAVDKSAVTDTCARFIAEVLKPRFLREVRPTPFNYPIDIFGKWRGRSYSFLTRYRSGYLVNAGEEFDAAFTRLDYLDGHLAKARFDVMWHRHTGQWYRLHASVTLDEALRLIETDGVLHPPI